MPDFDKEYGSKQWFYGNKPTPQLVIFVEHDHIPKGPAIDVGCGDGRNALYLAKQGFEVTGIDQSAEGIKHMIAAGAEAGVQINGVVSDVNDFDYPPAHYALIVAYTLLDHLDEASGNALIQKLIHATRPGGHLFISAFTVDDPGYIGQSGSNTNKYIRRYFAHNELRDLFSEVTLLRYQEEYYLDTAHGDPHHHCVARLMARRDR